MNTAISPTLQEKRQREARIFIAGFWVGFIPGLLMCLACVLVALYVRG